MTSGTRRIATTLAALFACVSVVAFSAIRPHTAAQSPSPQQVVNWGIAIHGGAGTIDTTRMLPLERQLRREALTRALTAGHRVLAARGRSLDAVQAAIVTLEDDSLFNAGKGAVFNAQGMNELDASLMDGKTHNVGAVAELHHVKNPILLARLVMDKSPHVMMVGEGAEQFARQQGVAMVSEHYFWTGTRWNQYLARKKAEAAGKTSEVSRRSSFGTVGAVAWTNPEILPQAHPPAAS